MDANATVSPTSALAVALLASPAELYYWQLEFLEKLVKENTGDPNATYYPSPELLFTPIGSHGLRGEVGPVLAYACEIYAHRPSFAEVVYVDARTGAVSKKKTPLSMDFCTAGTVNTNYYGSQIVFTDAGRRAMATLQ